MHYLFMLFMLSGLLLSSCADTPLPTEEENKRNEKPVIPPMVPETGTGLPQLYVDGRYLKNNEGQVINLHGFAQTYSPYFNQNAWETTMWQDVSVTTR